MGCKETYQDLRRIDALKEWNRTIDTSYDDLTPFEKMRSFFDQASNFGLFSDPLLELIRLRAPLPSPHKKNPSRL